MMAEMMPVVNQRIIYQRNNLFETLSDHHLFEKFRFPRRVIFDIVDIVRDDMTPNSLRNNAIPVDIQVAVALQFMATGSFFNVESSVYGISKSSVSRCVDKFVTALSRRCKDYIKMPLTQEERKSIKMKFYDIAGFPNVLGVLDGSQIPIGRPKDDDHLFVCRKGYHSINVQAVCGPNKEFLDIVAKWPGSTHDAFIWSNSQLSTRFVDGEYGSGWLLGDSGYPLKSHLLTPLAVTTNDNHRRYNNAHRRTRVLIENTFGIWKSRFRCLDKSGGKLLFTPSKCCKIIVSAAVLHNIAIRNNLPQPHFDNVLDDNDNIVFQDPIDVNGKITRTALINSAFS